MLRQEGLRRETSTSLGRSAGNECKLLVVRTFDLRRDDQDPIACFKHLLSVNRQSVNSDEIIRRLTRLEGSFDELRNRRAIRDVDMVAVATTEVVDE